MEEVFRSFTYLPHCKNTLLRVKVLENVTEVKVFKYHHKNGVKVLKVLEALRERRPPPSGGVAGARAKTRISSVSARTSPKSNQFLLVPTYRDTRIEEKIS